MHPGAVPTGGDRDAASAIDWVPVDAPLTTVCAGAGPTVVFVHGFTQTGRSWQHIADRFASRGYRCVLIDLPGHGGSAAVRADLPTAGMLVAESADRVAPRWALVGYSLGARVCLHTALARPDAVERLAVIGAHPGIEDDDERAARRDADERVASHLAAVGVADFLRDWVAQPLFGARRPTDDDLADRLRNTVDGLASSLRLAGTGTQVPLWPRLARLAMPLLALAGADDHKFAALAQRLAAVAPHGLAELVDGASHAAHLDQPDAVSDALARFFATP